MKARQMRSKTENASDKENAADTQGASDAQTKSSGTAGIFRLKDIRLEGNELTLKGENETLITVCNDGTLEFYDKAGEPLEVINDGNRITFSDFRFAAVSVTYSQNTVYYDLGYDEPADFYLQDDIFYGIGQNGALSESVTLNKRFGEALYPLFTGAGLCVGQYASVVDAYCDYRTWCRKFCNVFSAK